MIWEQKDVFYLESDNGYKVSKAVSGGALRFTAWAPKPPYKKVPDHWAENMHVALGTLDRAEDARALCEEHAKQQEQRKAS